MYRDSTDWLRFTYEVDKNDYGYDNPSIIITMYRDSDTVKIEATNLQSNEVPIEYGIARLDGTYKRADLSNGFQLNLDKSTSLTTAEMTKNEISNGNSFVTNNIYTFFDEINNVLSNASISLKDLGFINY